MSRGDYFDSYVISKDIVKAEPAHGLGLYRGFIGKRHRDYPQLWEIFPEADGDVLPMELSGLWDHYDKVKAVIDSYWDRKNNKK